MRLRGIIIITDKILRFDRNEGNIKNIKFFPEISSVSNEQSNYCWDLSKIGEQKVKKYPHLFISKGVIFNQFEEYSISFITFVIGFISWSLYWCIYFDIQSIFKQDRILKNNLDQNSTQEGNYHGIYQLNKIKMPH
jgi:hypothetical protein